MLSAFNTLGIRAELADRLAQEGITAPTPVQETAIPVLLKGEDAIVQAQTGTGKTLAFALPILEQIHPGKAYTQALILTPTRELAIQITAELAKLAPVLGITVLAAYGGQDVEAQIRKLRNAPHIVVATPGRLLDHLRRETVALSSIRLLVLDEADQMLHMGFLPEVEAIIDQCSLKRQTMLFSATMPESVKQLAARYMDTPQDIRIKSAAVTLDAIEQLVVITTDRNKQALLIRLIEIENPYLAVVFCRTKLRAKKLTEGLQEAGIPADELHGDLTQAKREAVMKRFRSAKLQVLVATDVAARGLDVEGVTHVFNYDAPADGDTYIHRIGRTGRAGEQGKAITLATPRDGSSLETIEHKIRASIKRMHGSEYGVGNQYSQQESDEHRKPATSRSTRRGSAATGGSSRGSRSGGRSGQASRAPRTGGKTDKPAARGPRSSARPASASSWTDDAAPASRRSSGSRPNGGRTAASGFSGSGKEGGASAGRGQRSTAGGRSGTGHTSAGRGQRGAAGSSTRRGGGSSQGRRGR